MSGKRKLSALRTKQKIIDAVKELCDEKKMNEITIEEITKRAEVAKGTFYVHFKRKEDVLSEVHYESFNQIIATINDSNEDVYLQIKEFLIRSVKLIVDGTLTLAQNWMKYSVAPLPGEELGIKKYYFDLDFIKSCLQSAVERGELKENIPVESISREIVSQYYGIVALWCLTSGEFSPVDEIKYYCENSLKLILEKYR